MPGNCRDHLRKVRSRSPRLSRAPAVSFQGLELPPGEKAPFHPRPGHQKSEPKLQKPVARRKSVRARLGCGGLSEANWFAAKTSRQLEPQTRAASPCHASPNRTPWPCLRRCAMEESAHQSTRPPSPRRTRIASEISSSRTESGTRPVRGLVTRVAVHVDAPGLRGYGEVLGGCRRLNQPAQWTRRIVEDLRAVETGVPAPAGAKGIRPTGLRFQSPARR